MLLPLSRRQLLCGCMGPHVYFPHAVMRCVRQCRLRCIQQ